MQKELIKNSLYLLAVLIFNSLFYREGMGINILIFTLLMSAIAFYIFPEIRSSRNTKIAIAATIFSAIMVVVHHSIWSQFIYWLSFITMVGFVQQGALRFLWYAFLLGLWSMLKAPFSFIKSLLASNIFFKTKGVWKYIYLSVLPLIVLVVFFLLYSAANERFAELTNNAVDFIINFISFDISFDRVFFILLAMFVCGGLMLKNKNTAYVNWEAQKTEDITRSRQKSKHSKGMLDLKNEFRMQLILLGSLNLLLLFVNLIDIESVWLNFNIEQAGDLRKFVHEGTYVLIFTILLAMLVLLIAFRRNLNFYPQNKWLKIAAYTWIVQNAVLAFSVGMRNWHYIANFGLAYKRVGVIIFLLLVLIGLFLMYIKVKDRKSLHFLLVRNAWAVFAVFILTTAINWDVLITRFNLNRNTNQTLDYRFIMRTISDKNIYILTENKEAIVNASNMTMKQVTSDIASKIERFRSRTDRATWKTWNWADERNKRKLDL